MATSPWTFPAPSGSETLRAPARSSSSDCSLTTAAPVPARSSPAPSVAQTTAGRTSTSLAAIALIDRRVHAGVAGHPLRQEGPQQRLELALVRQRLAGVATPGELAGEQDADDAVEHLGDQGGLGHDAHGGGVSEVAVARVEHHQVGAVAHGPAKRGAGHRVVVHGAVADHENGARLLEHAQGAGGVAHAGAHPRARERDA